MCWMSIYRGENAAADALTACQENEQKSGGHSWGLAAVVDGSLMVSHGLGRIPDDVIGILDGLEVTVALGHTRMATRGEVTIDNAHPFPIRDADGDMIAALAHNGTWYGAPEDEERCDSYYIARLLESMYRADPDQDFGRLVERTGDITGETLTVLHQDGTGYAYSGRYGITEGDGCVRSTGRTPIPHRGVRTV